MTAVFMLSQPSYSHLDTVPVSGVLHQQLSLQQWKCDDWTQFVYLSTSCSAELGPHTDIGHNEGMWGKDWARAVAGYFD